MQFVYKPEGATPVKWDFAPDRLMNVEAEAIERATKMTYAEWATAVTNGSMTALHGLLWVLLKRKDPTLKWEAVVFSLSEIDFELSDDEAAEALASLEQRIASGEELDANETAVLNQLRADAPSAPVVTEDESADVSEDDGPKD